MKSLMGVLLVFGLMAGCGDGSAESEMQETVNNGPTPALHVPSEVARPMQPAAVPVVSDVCLGLEG